jgi:hypothetical protein
MLPVLRQTTAAGSGEASSRPDGVQKVVAQSKHRLAITLFPIGRTAAERKKKATKLAAFKSGRKLRRNCPEQKQ